MGLARGWAHRTPDLCALSYRFAVRSDDPCLGRRADALLAGLRDRTASGDVDHWYSLTVADATAGTVDVARDAEHLARGQQPGDALGWVIWDVNRAAAEAGREHLLFHAGAVEADGTGVLLPGASLSGKSTLVAGLVRRGFGYLTDELAALDMATTTLLPFAKPITVKPGSFAVLADMRPDEPWSGAEWQVAVGPGTGRRLGRPCVPGLVVVPRFDAGAGATTLTPLSQTEAFFALALHAVNLVPHGAAGTGALGRLATRCRCFALTVSDLDEACRLVADLVVGVAAAAATAASSATSPDGRRGGVACAP